MFQSLESLQAQEDARSKRHSTSELGIITFSDVHKEGWLHYKQILTEKGKVKIKEEGKPPTVSAFMQDVFSNACPCPGVSKPKRDGQLLCKDIYSDFPLSVC